MEILLTLTGGLLVLLTWVGCAVAVISLGVIPATLLSRALGSRSGSRSATGSGVAIGFGVVVRHSLWWGLLLITLWAYALNLFVPLGSAVALVLTLLLVLVVGVIGVVVLRRVGVVRDFGSLGSLSWAWKLAVGAVGLAVVYFAFAAIGPVTNYDTGLYHLGAIRYSTEYSTIPGLANLYFPLGYSNAQVPVAALLSNGPWGLNGFRLFNGFLIFLVGIELFLRVLVCGRARTIGPGIYVLFVGFVVALIPLVALADFWVASPTQDAAAFVLTVVASSYLVDAVQARKHWVSPATVLGVLAITLVLFRPTAAFFALSAFVVVVLLAIRRRGTRRGLALGGGVVLGAGLVALGVSTARDYFLSGWFQYPLSLFSFPVEWKAADPTPFREVTLGFHRNPREMWESLSGFDWVGVWFVDRFSQWETYVFILLAMAVAILAFVVRPRLAFWRLAALSAVPSLVAVLAWFVLTPPSYRFAWGPLFTLLTIPLGWLLWKISVDRVGAISRVAVAGGALAVVAVTVFSTGFRLDWAAIDQDESWTLGVSIPYQVAPVVSVPVVEQLLPSGLAVLVPVASDQCWDNYPLCTPAPSADLRVRSGDQDEFDTGFLP
jgi:hypothetical protein